MPEHDNVTRPKHYMLLPGVEVKDVRDVLLDKCDAAGWNGRSIDYWSRAWEYLTRAMEKNGKEDLEKAKAYLEWLIGEFEE